MEKKSVFTVARLCKGHGGGISMPIGCFATQDAANDAKQDANGKMRRLMQCQLVQVTGPDLAEPIGMTVAQLMQLLGIEHVEFFAHEMDVHESALVQAPDRRIIVPN